MSILLREETFYVTYEDPAKKSNTVNVSRTFRAGPFTYLVNVDVAAGDGENELQRKALAAASKIHNSALRHYQQTESWPAAGPNPFKQGGAAQAKKPAAEAQVLPPPELVFSPEEIMPFVQSALNDAVAIAQKPVRVTLTGDPTHTASTDTRGNHLFNPQPYLEGEIEAGDGRFRHEASHDRYSAGIVGLLEEAREQGGDRLVSILNLIVDRKDDDLNCRAHPGFRLSIRRRMAHLIPGEKEDEYGEIVRTRSGVPIQAYDDVFVDFALACKKRTSPRHAVVRQCIGLINRGIWRVNGRRGYKRKKPRHLLDVAKKVMKLLDAHKTVQQRDLGARISRIDRELARLMNRRRNLERQTNGQRRDLDRQGSELDKLRVKNPNDPEFDRRQKRLESRASQQGRQEKLDRKRDEIKSLFDPEKDEDQAQADGISGSDSPDSKPSSEPSGQTGSESSDTESSGKPSASPSQGENSGKGQGSDRGSSSEGESDLQARREELDREQDNIDRDREELQAKIDKLKAEKAGLENRKEEVDRQVEADRLEQDRREEAFRKFIENLLQAIHGPKVSGATRQAFRQGMKRLKRQRNQQVLVQMPKLVGQVGYRAKPQPCQGGLQGLGIGGGEEEPVVKVARDAAAYASSLARVSQHVRKLKEVLRELASPVPREVRGLERGELDMENLPTLLTGGRDCMMRHEEHLKLDVALAYLLDISGSMHGQIDTIDLGTAFCEALIGHSRTVESSFWGFNNAVYDCGKAERGNGIASLECDGGTLEYYGLWTAGSSLMPSRRKRKLVIVVCDGGCAYPDKVRQVCATLLKAGIIPIRALVGIDHAPKVYPIELFFEDFEDLFDSLAHVFRNILRAVRS